MKNFYSVFFLFLFAVFISAKNPDENCRILFPKHIPANSPFDISLIISNNFPQADQLELFILSEENILLKKSDIRTPGKITKANFSLSEFENFSGLANKIIINLKDSLISELNYFQIFLSFESENINKTSLKFTGFYKSNDSIIAALRNDELFSDDGLISIELDFYKPQRVAGSALIFNPESSFEYSLKEREIKNLLTEFWIKLNNNSLSFFKISSKINPLFNFELHTNTSQMLLVNSASTAKYINPQFLSRKSWYFISVNISSEKNLISFYCNNILFAEYSLDNNSLPADFIFEFFNKEKNKSFHIDFLRLISLNGSRETFYESANFLSFYSDSSSIISQYSFNNRDELFSNERRVELSINNLQFIKSDAPLFAKAPELNINILSNSFELEWSGGDYKQAVSYTLEKSSGGREYIPLLTVQAENSLEKVYRFLDKADEASDIIFYRVKQINNDGTVVYSSQVKVGKGFMEPFTVEQNYPNPFNPKTSINFELLEDMEIEITIYNLEGREIEKLHKGFLTKGLHTFTFDGSELPSGIYLYKIQGPDYSQTRKMILANSFQKLKNY